MYKRIKYIILYIFPLSLMDLPSWTIKRLTDFNLSYFYSIVCSFYDTITEATVFVMMSAYKQVWKSTKQVWKLTVKQLGLCSWFQFVLIFSVCWRELGGALQEKADLWNTTENHSKSYITLYRY